MKVVEAKNNPELLKLVEEVRNSGEILITHNGKPVARLVPDSSTKKQRKLGIYKGQVYIAPDFDEEDERIIKLFEEGK